MRLCLSDRSTIGTAADFVHDFITDTWTHPETDVLILGEDMPRELIPWCRIVDETT